MIITKSGLDLIKRFESLHDGDLKAIGLQPKMCPAQVWTVGYGRALVDPVTKQFLKGPQDKAKAYAQYPALTVAEAEKMLLEDTTDFSKQVVRLLGKRKLNENQFSALVSFSYNLGAGALSRSTLLKKLLANPNDPTIRAEFDKWVKSGGEVLRGLVLRRKAEADLYFS